MPNSDVIQIRRSTGFSLKEAQEILPLVKRVTDEHRVSVEGMISRLELISSQNTALIDQLEAAINSEIKSWQDKIRKLGGVPKGLWLVDFDSGSGYFCWKYPEDNILYWHSYADGFTKRRPVLQNASPNS